VHAIGFYQSMGFHVVSDVFDEAGIPHRSMERET
jgi:predicted GNAT family N-acyltransferase